MNLSWWFALFLIFFVPVPAGAWTPANCVLGPGNVVQGGPASDDLSTNGRDAEDQWKIFRWQAVVSGEIYLGAIRIESIPQPSMVSSVDLQFAVYEDNAGEIGSLKVWGYKIGYNFNTIGVGRHYFDLTQVVTNRTVVAGRFYWIAWRSNMTPSASENYIYFERQGSDPIPVGLIKKGAGVIGGSFSQMPPNGSNYSTVYADNYYGWTVWTASDGGVSPPRDTMPPSPPPAIR